MRIERKVINVNRTVGAMLSGEVARRYGHAGLPDNTINVKLTGVAGQSFGAFLAHGVTLDLTGDANDYVGKGLSGGRVIVRQPGHVERDPTENIIVGNTVLYGAIAGEAYFNGVAGERFAVRNSGAVAVVEGTGDHGCEYMTGGVVLVLGKTGRNFAAGMSGGVAYVYDEGGEFAELCNPAQVDLLPVSPEQGRRRRCRPSAAARWRSQQLRHGRHAAPRCRAHSRAARTPPPSHRQQARPRAARRFRRRAWQVRQGDAARLRQGAAATWKPNGSKPLRLQRSNRRWARKPAFSNSTGRTAAMRTPRNGLATTRNSSIPHAEPALKAQASRCMNCGIPYCHNGCPVNNIIPDWNHLVYEGDWSTALEVLHSTNNFPEFTGRICPAPCEASCTLNIVDQPVTIKSIECAIVDRGWQEGWIEPQVPAQAHRQVGRRGRLGPGRAWLLPSNSRGPAIR